MPPTEQAAYGRFALPASALAVLVLIGFLSAGREFMTFGVETDFIYGFMPEARSFLAGEPLAVLYHPPLYSMTLASIYTVVGNWFASGLLLSWISCAVTLFVAPMVLHRLYGRAAAIGAFVAMVGSHLFVTYSAMATSDIYGMAAFYGTILAFLTAGAGERRWTWCCAGITLGLALLTRTNAVVLVLLVGLPLITAGAWRRRGIHAACAALGALIPLGIWCVYAFRTGSNLLPSGGVVDNMAMTYLSAGESGIGFEGMTRVQGRFDGVLDFLLHDPAGIAKFYVRDLYWMTGKIFGTDTLLDFPLHYLAFFGLAALAWRSRTLPSWVVLGCCLSHVAVVNFKTFDSRFYLFLLPILGAGLGLGFSAFLVRVKQRAGRAVLIGLALILSTLAVAQSLDRSPALLHEQDEELGAAIAAATPLVDRDTQIIARKPHLAYYTDSLKEFLPETLEELREKTRTKSNHGPVLLYLGSDERRRRPELRDLFDPSEAPAWLVPLARGDEAGGWVLYRVGREMR